MGGKEVTSHGGPSTTPVSGSVGPESVSAPLPPQLPGSSQEEVEEKGGLLQSITEMESPLSGTDSSDEDYGHAGRDGMYPDREVSAGCEESHIDTNSAEQECCMNIETAEQEGRMNAETNGVFSKQKTLLDDETAGNCGTSGTMVSGTVVLEGRTEDQVLGNLPNQISGVSMQPVNNPMQPVNLSSVPVNSYAKAVSGQSHGAGGGREPVVRLSPNTPSSIKCRNVAQLRWEGGGIPPIRRVVVDRILAMVFKAEDIYALISAAGSFDYDLSFVHPDESVLGAV
ncbi:hypothetical protein AB205_0120200 [Aquarana catesbeiana]|uniref:Zinc finger CCHC domain-containing protein n=1 Tax=Aquarana catesbeiana TaxID=8400 RepID=A0A2G9RK63_AQUCT|nr:hypothetical protein AB205_0120200 [Aquarana catesbeiana]